MPPQAAPVLSATVGTTTLTGISRPSQYTLTATLNILAGAATGPQTVTVQFPGPPENPTDIRTFTLVGGFTIL